MVQVLSCITCFAFGFKVTITKYDLMKTPWVIIFLFLNCALPLNAQDAPKQENRHVAWVVLADSTELKGLLYSATEAGILLTGETANDIIDPANISTIKIRRKGNVSSGALVGAVGGAVLGFSVGILSGDDEPGFFSSTKEEKGGIGALLLAPLGSGVGALIGTKKISIPINGSTETYRAQLATIQAYCLK